MNNVRLHRLAAGVIATSLLLALLAPVPALTSRLPSVAGDEYPVHVYVPLVVSSVPEMVSVPAGKFMMGCASGDEECEDDEHPLHEVDVDGYRIDSLEVTYGEYEACVEAGACGAVFSQDTGLHPRSSGNLDYSDHPVIYVSWDDARDYCAWAGKRLPTEAEWEKAARGDGDTRIYPWGDEDPDCDRVNYVACTAERDPTTTTTMPVGSHPAGASRYGALDMAGNVMEWVADSYSEDYYGSSPAANPPGPPSGEYKVIRGGAWSSGREYVRVSDRHQHYPNVWRPDVGFRCAMDGAGE